MNLEIVDSTYEHCSALAFTIREQDRLEAERLGLESTHAIYESFTTAIIRKTALVDGKVAAMFGVIGTLFGHGKPYFITGVVAETVPPVTFAKTYKREFDKFKDSFLTLSNVVDAEYYGAIRLLKIAGFTVYKPITLGPQEALFRRFTYSNE